MKHVGLSILMIASVSAAAVAQPVLPDWRQATFDAGSSISNHPYYPLVPGTLSIYEGEVEEGQVEHIETLVTFETKTILGIENRVIRDSTFIDGRLVEVADDWYAQSTDGTVWYFGEFVVNFHYDRRGRLIGADNTGSWIADGFVNFPGAIMLAQPEVGNEYFQEYAPRVALDFAIVNSLDEQVNIPFGSFENVLHTSEGNLVDGPFLSDNKLYAPRVGLVLIEALDEHGKPEFVIPIISKSVVFSIETLGQCPGTIVVRSVSASPNGPVALFFANAQGSTIIPNGACSGARLGLAPIGLIRVGFARANNEGVALFEGRAGARACRGFMQAIDGRTCKTSNVEPLP